MNGDLRYLAALKVGKLWNPTSARAWQICGTWRRLTLAFRGSFRLLDKKDVAFVALVALLRRWISTFYVNGEIELLYAGASADRTHFRTSSRAGSHLGPHIAGGH
jgi:hypothetical protein